MTYKEKTTNILSTTCGIVKAISRSFVFCWKNIRSSLLLNTGVMLLTALLPFITLSIWQYLINRLIESKSAAFSDFAIWTSVFIFFAAQLLYQFLMIFQFATQNNATEKVLKINKLRIMDKLREIDMPSFDDPQFHRALSVLNDIPNYSEITKSVLNLLSAVISVIVAVMAICGRYPVAAVAIVVFQIPTTVILCHNAFMSNALWQNQNDDHRKVAYYRNVLTSRSYAKELRLYKFEEYFLGLYRNLWLKMFRAYKKLQEKQTAYELLGGVVGMCGITVLIYSIIPQAVAGKIFAGDIYFYLGLGITLMASTENVGWEFASLYQDYRQCEDVFEQFLSIPHLMESGSQRFPHSPSIEFSNVSFKYPNSDKFVLKNVSFKLKPGEKLLLAGVNGAGKTTLTKLLMRLYDPTEGEILFDGLNAKMYDVQSLRAAFGVLFQETELYVRNFKDNVQISDLEVNDYNRYENSLYMSGADKVRTRLLDGDTTEITRQYDDNGFEPSGGEGQRIGLARAYYRNADIVILDEPSSAQDAAAEDHIFKELIKNYAGKSTILISHRLSVASIVDKVALVENGKLEEFGTHEQLIAACGRYRQLYDMQASGYLKGVSNQ